MATAVTAPAIAKLIHHDERSRIANSEFSFIFQSMTCLTCHSQTNETSASGQCRIAAISRDRITFARFLLAAQ